jgi:hypothetical protein
MQSRVVERERFDGLGRQRTILWVHGNLHLI